MSFSALHFLHCDAPDESEESGPCGASTDSYSLESARSIAIERGWQRDALGRDFCPTHVSYAQRRPVGLR